MNPRVSLPLLLGGWTLRPEIGLRETYYTQRQVPNSQYQRRPAQSPSSSTSIATPRKPRSSCARRHWSASSIARSGGTSSSTPSNRGWCTATSAAWIISPTSSASIPATSSPTPTSWSTRSCSASTSSPRAGQSAASHRPPRRLRPPPAHAVTGDQERVLPGPAAPANCVSWELKQKYFFDPYFGGALVNGVRNVFTTTDNFTGIAFLASPRRFTPIVSRILVHPSNQTEFGWQLDYDTVASRINASTRVRQLPAGKLLPRRHAHLLPRAVRPRARPTTSTSSG